MNQSDVVVTSDGRTVSVRDWLAENVDRRKKAEARVAALEQQVERLWRLFDEQAGVSTTQFVRAMNEKARANKAEAQLAEVDQVHARLLCEALGEEYEPRNRDEWRRTFAEMLPYVKSRSDAWRTLLTRIEEVDPEWLDQWRAGLATGEHMPCPDGGRCHHECQRGDCFRVRCCGPLSGIYPGDVWPDEVVQSLLYIGKPCAIAPAVGGLVTERDHRVCYHGELWHALEGQS